MSAESQAEIMQEAVETITGLAREGFSEIAAIAGLLQCRIEKGLNKPHDEIELYDAIRAIRGKAQDIQSCIASEAEHVGIVTTTELRRRRGLAISQPTH